MRSRSIWCASVAFLLNFASIVPAFPGEDPKEKVDVALAPARFWGEVPGPVRSLIPRGDPPLFRWEGKVEDYAVLEITEVGVATKDCGRGGTKAGILRWNGKGGDLRGAYLVLSTCTGPGRIRVIQPGNLAGGSRPLVEIDDRKVEGASAYVIEGHAVPRERVDALHPAPAEFGDRWAAAEKAVSGGDLAGASSHWSWIATHTREDAQRLWAIEKLCMSRPYPGAAPNPVEQATLSGYAEKEPIDVLAGVNVILAWPKDYAVSTPTRWRFLAEMDAALDWLREWTGRDQVASRGKRLIVRFRTDDGGTALFVDFRLHIPRKEMKFPPDHGPYSHEASHGFIGFPAICPTGRYSEGLTEVSRTSYWWFLGIEDSWRPFRENCMKGLGTFIEKGGRLDGVPSYGAAAGVYFGMEDAVRDGKGDVPDWSRFTKLFDAARGVDVAKDVPVPERFRLFAEVCGKALGEKAGNLLKKWGLP